MSVSKTDNSQRCIDAINEAVSDALGEIGKAASDHAKGTVHVITGNLRDSIGYSVADNKVTIFADMPYAAYEELGTSRQDAHPYLKPSVVNHTDEYVNMVANEIKKTL